MKKLLSLSVVFVLVGALLVGCAGKKGAEDTNETKKDTNETTKTDESKDGYKDGVYFASEDGFAEKSGWKDVVTLEVKDGKIVATQWNGAHKDGGVDKVTASKDGLYKMVEYGKAKAPWFEQAAAVEAFLLEKQDPTAVKYSDDKGHTDAISGATINVKGFFGLVEKALAAGPVGVGKYKDGQYHAEDAEFKAQSGWKSTVDLTVINGNIVAANWNGLHKDGGADKKTQSIEGNYKMVELGKAKAPWFEQAAAAEAFLLEKQDPSSINYADDKGHTDAISGVSITVNSFFKLAEEALTKAK